MTTSASRVVPDARQAKDPRRWLSVLAWSLLAIVTCALLLLGVLLLIRMRLFSASTTLTDEQLKSLWAFLGVSLGVVATLIGTLLTEQNNRRADMRGKEAENRLTLDTRAKVLELITENGKYAQKARVGGAVATMMELRGGPVAIRILGDLWESDDIGTSTASWLIDQVLASPDSSDDEKIQAATLLAIYAPKLLPAKGHGNQEWNAWPTIVRGHRWPHDLPEDARVALLVASLNTLCAREVEYWAQDQTTFPIRTMIAALDDDRVAFASAAALDEVLRSGVNQIIFNESLSGLADRLPPLIGDEEHAWVKEVRSTVRTWLTASSYPPPES